MQNWKEKDFCENGFEIIILGKKLFCAQIFSFWLRKFFRFGFVAAFLEKMPVLTKKSLLDKISSI